MYQHTLPIALLCTMYSITPTTTTPTPLYVFSQVISLPEGMEVVVDQEFIRNAEELIQDQDDREEDEPEEREARSHCCSQIVESSQSFPMVRPSGSEDTTLPIVILSIVGAVLGGTLAVLVRVLIQFYRGHKDNTESETDGSKLMREKLASLREARDRLDYYGAGRGRTENVYVSSSVMV